MAKKEIVTIPKRVEVAQQTLPNEIPFQPIADKVVVTIGTVVQLENNKYLHMWTENRGVIMSTPNAVPGVGYFVQQIDVQAVKHQIIYGKAFIIRQKRKPDYSLNKKSKLS